MLAWYREHLEFLVPVGRGYDVDPDCMALGFGNRDPRLFAAVIAQLERDPQDERARRVLLRYVPATAPTASSELRAWLERVKPYLYFTDKGGFEWRVDEAALAVGRPRARRGASFAAPPVSVERAR